MRKPVRWVLLIVVVLFFGIVLADSLGVFDDATYFEVPHGNHSHFVPKDCDPPLPVANAPQRAPGPGQRIDCQGRIVPE